MDRVDLEMALEATYASLDDEAIARAFNKLHMDLAVATVKGWADVGITFDSPCSLARCVWYKTHIASVSA